MNEFISTDFNFSLFRVFVCKPNDAYEAAAAAAQQRKSIRAFLCLQNANEQSFTQTT